MLCYLRNTPTTSHPIPLTKHQEQKVPLASTRTHSSLNRIEQYQGIKWLTVVCFCVAHTRRWLLFDTVSASHRRFYTHFSVSVTDKKCVSGYVSRADVALLQRWIQFWTLLSDTEARFVGIYSQFSLMLTSNLLWPMFLLLLLFLTFCAMKL